jgi:putative ATP-binding cassette transporter
LVSGAIGFVLFLLPNFGALDVPRAYQLALILNLIDAPLLIFASQLHLMVRARISYRNLQELDDRLPPEPATVAGEQPTTFSQIALVEADFHYPSQGGKQFGVGPISFSFGPGEIVFITGENGSGKTTLMKLLAGLYPSQKGALLLNGARLAADKLSHYRGLFSTIFSDNVLLRQLYDETVDPAQVTALLRRFNLRSSTDFVDGCFTSTDLSSGQARRLAMVVALLEDRPILLLDEWTAHQDPERRRFFYEELLPELRQRGKTIIAVSHDDRFFHCADRRIQLASGQLQESSC